MHPSDKEIRLIVNTMANLLFHFLYVNVVAADNAVPVFLLRWSPLDVQCSRVDGGDSNLLRLSRHCKYSVRLEKLDKTGWQLVPYVTNYTRIHHNILAFCGSLAPSSSGKARRHPHPQIKNVQHVSQN